MKNFAVIDLGSNSVRMSIFDADNPAKEVKAYRSVIRLSEGMGKDDVLGTKPQMRAVSALLQYKEILNSQGICDVFAIATAAVRKAKNKSEFLNLVKDTCDINIIVIDGKTEAALDSLAVSRRLNCQSGIICDIGGGSTELIGICEGDSPMISIPYGSRSLCEMFFEKGETSESRLKAQDFTEELLSKVDWIKDFSGGSLVGIGGTLRAVAELDILNDGLASLEKYEISTDRITCLIHQIENSTTKERSKMPGIGTERADIIIGGAILLKAILNHTAPKKIVVADVGIREGVFFDLTENHGILKINE